MGYKKRSIRLRASFTIEASFVMAIIMFTIATGLICAFKMRDTMVTEFVTHAASVDGAYTEEEWLENDSNVVSVGNRANSRLHAIGALGSTDANVERTEANILSQGKCTVELTGGKSLSITTGINDPEEYLRVKAVLLDLKGESSDGD